MAGLVVESAGGATYNTFSRPHHHVLTVFVPVAVAESYVVSRIIEDDDPNEPAPPAVIPAAPVPEDRRDTQIFAYSVAQLFTSRPDESVVTVADI